MINADPTTLALEFCGGALIGALVGFGTKRIAKLLAIIIGVQLMVFRYLESQGIVVVDYNRLTAGLVDAQEQAQVQAAGTEIHQLESLLSVASVGIGFTSGFLIGFHRG
ncbi:FUN14 domain-containing protein [Natronobacterium texcoconense]|uniref:Uncharacterized membrane protein, Fun14 family n=1 Tax=Natronobacterium texcoconense TaxID=1095778 RepID=A0A1H1CNL5_NATTX|nr:FUN14 domain-containing protein [Natronobacterium texcoconense]SDQ65851.1 Uncharacterized membrane protein, Fun14 family [Natronobacterium texcoconense]